MKKGIIKSVILLIVFVISFSVISNIMNKENTNMTGEMKSCTFPTITALYGEREINRLYGYGTQMLANYMRDTITPLDSDGKLSILIQTYGTEVTAIGYEIRSPDTNRLIEDTKVREWGAASETIQVKLNIQDLLEEDTEYVLIIKLATKEEELISYYTRIIKDIGFHTQEKLDFIVGFHEMTFQKEDSQELIRFLESNSNGDNTSFHFVNINSSYDQVTWGNLPIERETGIVVQLQELNNETAVFLLKYRVRMENDTGETEHYNIEEFYRVRYTRDRMYLLAFDRTMDQVFEEENAVFYSTSLQLGITKKNVEYMDNEEGTIVSFVQAGELYCYDKSGDKLAKVFGFSQSKTDIREQYDQHDIKIINVDEGGNTDFIVYGYMNRGRHEGKVGVSVCRYDSRTGTVEEYMFLSTQKPYQILKEEVGQLAYLNRDGILYIHFKGSIYAIRSDTKEADIVVENIQERNLVISEDNTRMAWREEPDLNQSQTIVLMDFETGKQQKITTDETERIKPIGFMGMDFIFGIAKADDIQSDSSGSILFPMYKVLIQNQKHEIIKEYQTPNVYVSNSEIYENMIRLVRMVKNADGTYSETSEDQLVNSNIEGSSKISIVSTVTEKKKKQYQLDLGVPLKSANPTLLYPKEVLYEESNEVVLASGEQEEIYYYVYAKGKLDSLYINATEALTRAADIAGIVVTDTQACIWERTRRVNKRQLFDIETISTTQGMNSAAACAAAILRNQGILVDPGAMLQQGYTVTSLLEEQLGREKVVNLKGCTLDAALYSVSRGYPVLAMTDSESYVIIVGYNELNTIVMDPKTGNTGYVGMNDSKALFESAGNVFTVILLE